MDNGCVTAVLKETDSFPYFVIIYQQVSEFGRSAGTFGDLIHFWANVWIKMPLGREVGLVPSNIVLDRDPAPPPQKGGRAPIFGPRLLWPNGWVHQSITWHGGRPQPRRHCVRWGPSPSKKGTAPSNFRPMTIVAKRLDG